MIVEVLHRNIIDAGVWEPSKRFCYPIITLSIEIAVVPAHMLPTLWLLAIAIVYVGKGGVFDVMHHYRHGIRLLRTDVDVITGRLPASELPAAIVNHAEYNSVMHLRGTSGPESVQRALQIVQRLILQLDRSDKRADLGPDVLANRFNSFFSTCLQSSGSSWTAALGPLVRWREAI